MISRYAIGGAIAATRYIEPIQTYDLDVFVFLLFLKALLSDLDCKPGGSPSMIAFCQRKVRHDTSIP